MMSLYSSSGQYVVTRAVILPLRDGLSSFINLYDSLLCVNDPFQNLFGYRDVRGLIVRAEQDMWRALQEAERGLRQLDQDTETLTAQQHTSNRERQGKIQLLGDLRTKLDGEKRSLESSEEALEQARRRLRDGKAVVKKQKDRQATAGVMMGVGLALTPIPIFGQAAELVLLGAAGAVLAVGGAVDLVQAEEAIRIAEREVTRQESQVETYSYKVSDYESKITQTERDIARTDEDLRRMRERLSEIQNQRWALAQFQEKMRGAVHLLGRLSGSAHVLELQTRGSIHLEPVMKLLEEVVKVAGEVTGHQLLRDEGVLSLVDAMRHRNSRLTALCASHNTPAMQHYI